MAKDTRFATPKPLSSHGPARIIAMCNQKGGVGKTTTTINLAASLVEYGRRVLLIDYDPQGALSAGLGIQAKEGETIYDLMKKPSLETKDFIRHTKVEGLDVIPADIDLSAAEMTLVTEFDRERILKKILKKVQNDYDVIFIDCQPSLGLLTVNALTAAHGVIIPLAAEFFALRGVKILEDIMPKLVNLAPDAVFLLVTNPCDVLAYAAVQISGLPANNVFSSGTVLDSSRLRWQLAERAGVSTESVHAMIVGEHGDSEFPLWSEAKIGPIKLSEWKVGNRSLHPEELDEIADQVKNAAYKVIEGKGATNYAIGLSAARIVEAVLRDESVILPVSSVLTDYLGISDVALSVPTVVNRQGASKTIPMEMSATELTKLQASANALKASIASLGIN